MDLDDVCKQMDKMEQKVDALVTSVAKLQGADGLVKLLCKWVIFPLIVIVAALTGLNLALPVG